MKKYCRRILAEAGSKYAFILILSGGPKIVSHDNNKNMVQGDKLELKCEVTGHPTPTVTWYKDGAPLNDTDRISFLEYKGTKTGQLRIFHLDYEDDGNYSCLAENEIAPFNATAYMKLRVKGEAHGTARISMLND